MAEDIRDIASQLFTRDEAHQLYKRVCDLVRQRNELQEEVAALQETLGMFSALRDLIYDSPPTLYHVGQNGHVALPSPDAASDEHTALLVAANALHDGPTDGDLDAPVDLSIGESIPDEGNPAHDPSLDAIDHDAGDVSSVETESRENHVVDADTNPDEEADNVLRAEATNPDDDPADFHHDDTQQDASMTSTPTPPVSLLPSEHDAPMSPSAKTEPGNTAPSPTSRPVPDGPIGPVEAPSTAAPNPSVEAGEKTPAPGTLLAKILSLIEQSARPKRPWQVRKELGLPRLPCAELSRLVSEGHLVRVKGACYGLPNRDYNDVVSAEGDQS